MRIMKHAVIMAIAMTVFVVCFVVSPATAADGTARAWLEQAQQAAVKWNSDAVLVNISTLNAGMNGTAKKWMYMFYSARAKQGYTIDIQDGRITGTLEVRPYINDPVGKDFVDSPQAMEEAKKNGLKVRENKAMSLLVMGQATKTPGISWTVGGGYMPGEVNVIVNARTGKLFTRQEVK